MLAPPVALHAVAPPALAAAWAMLREALLAPGAVERDVREVVAAGVSQVNRCPYCIEVHGSALAGLLGGADARAVLVGGLAELRDARLRRVADWAVHGGPPPFPAEHAPELVGVFVVFHYLNRMVNVFLPESPLPPVPTPVAAALRRGAARLLGGLARTVVVPGEAPGLLPPAPLPADLSWAAGRPHVSAAFARAAAAVQAAGERSVPTAVRQLLAAQLPRLDTPPPALGEPTWFDAAVAALPVPDRAAGRLTLRIAFASYRVTDDDVARVRAAGYDDRALVELAAWSSLAAARHLGARALPGPATR
ncbi:carboxymuconolactone decarboxylase family protein [Micromonospora radicis]|uniref:Carboxymuconolactone decarboxylase family protein n=2 Tax=Micromonospora radicis TaxID=1894971 RepID=A0A418MZ40_9ACTN|nr:carboxymuconolactone decarboxylase family protein [Micromonospora radicis]